MDSDDMILLIASQMYHGNECIPKDDEVLIPIVSLNIDAGKIAIDRCHHDLAYIYLDTALSLLPDESWERYYDVNIRLHFLMANAANATYKYDEAEKMLQKVLSEGRCVEDNVSSYYLLSQSKCDYFSLFSLYCLVTLILSIINCI